jgi:hypothetical protein
MIFIPILAATKNPPGVASAKIVKLGLPLLVVSYFSVHGKTE